MPDEDKLKPGGDELTPGVDRPTRRQYVIGAVVIILASVAAYWWLGHHR